MHRCRNLLVSTEDWDAEMTSGTPILLVLLPLECAGPQ